MHVIKVRTIPLEAFWPSHFGIRIMNVCQVLENDCV